MTSYKKQFEILLCFTILLSLIFSVAVDININDNKIISRIKESNKDILLKNKILKSQLKEEISKNKKLREVIQGKSTDLPKFTVENWSNVVILRESDLK